MLPRITRRTWFLETGKEGFTVSRPRRRKQVLGPPGGGPGESVNTVGPAGNLAPLFNFLADPRTDCVVGAKVTKP